MVKKGKFGKYALAFMIATSSLAIADISGVVFKDYNNNGLKDDNNSVAYAVPVSANCDDGKTYSTTTDDSGSYTLSIPSDANKCRLDINASAIGLYGGVQSATDNIHPLVSVVNNGTTGYNISLSSPATYCQENPDVAMVTIPGWHKWKDNNNTTHWDPPSGDSTHPTPWFSLLQNHAPKNGTLNDRKSEEFANRKILETVENTGAIWGMAYQRGTKKIFTAAVLKRYAPLKDESTSEAVKASAGAIYVFDRETNTTSLFTTVPDALTEQAANDLSSRDYSASDKDTKVNAYTARQGLGDLDISEDDTKLYTINLNTKELVTIDAQNGNILSRVTIPNPYKTNPNPNNNNLECDTDKVRPWALKVRGEDIYIGSVCEDKIHDGLGAAIQKYNGSGFKTVAVTNSLQYLRAPAYNPYKTTGSNQKAYKYSNWRDHWETYYKVHTPLLSDIEFNNRGDLVLAYLSRRTFMRQGKLNGDIRKMCFNSDGTYTDESTELYPTSCASHEQVYPDNNTTYYEFYTGDHFASELYNNKEIHPETASGSLAQVPGAPNIIVGMIDVAEFYEAGALGNYDHSDGNKTGGTTMINPLGLKYGGEREVYGGKAGGIGDIELLCDLAPLEIGNYVWLDSDGDGIQDPEENGIAGVTVELVNSSGDVVGTAKTDDNGYYYFGGANNTNMNNGLQIQSNSDYELRISLSDSSLPKDAIVTKKDANNNSEDVHDSDGDSGELNNSYSTISMRTTTANNHTLDFGFTKASVGDKVWYDNNKNGIQDSDEKGVEGVTVNLLSNGKVVATTKTDSNGNYIFENLDAGDYEVAFDLSKLPAGYDVVDQGQGNNDTLDSDANDTTGKVAVNLAPGERNLTLDMGIAQYSSLGDRVWSDVNHDGIQDDDESGIEGITVKLLKDGNVTDTTITDKNGNYKFRKLSPGDYQIEVDPNKLPKGAILTLQTQGNDDTKDSDVDTTTGKSGTISLDAGTYDPNWDIGIFKPEPAVKLEKSTNGEDADTGAGPIVSIGDTVTWEYNITNMGSEELINIELSDDEEGNISCTQNSIPVGESIICTKTGTATSLGLYENNATVKATGKVSGEDVTASDLSHYTVPAVSLGSLVWEDTNNNGIQDAGESPIAGAVVKLLNSDGTAVAGIAPQTTGADGKYYFEGLKEGSYIVEVTPPAGYVKATVQNANADGDVDNDSNIKSKVGSAYRSGVVTLKNDDEPTEANGLAGSDDADDADDNNGNMTVDFGFVKLASIGDYVWEDTNANGIQDADESGIAGAKVELLDANGEVVKTYTTQADGKYEFKDLIPGDYKIKVTPPAGYVLTKQDANGATTDADSNNSNDDSDISVDTNTTVTINLHSGESDKTWDAGVFKPASIGNFIWEDENANGIQDKDEKPVAGVELTLVDGNGNPVTDVNGDAVLPYTTKEDGKYSFTNLVPGEYQVKVTKVPDGYLITRENKGKDDSKDSDISTFLGKTGDMPKEVLTSGENNTTFDGGIFKSRCLGSYIWLDDNANGIKDEGESGIKGVEVKLIPVTDEFGNKNEQNVLGESYKTFITDDSGEFKFCNLIPGKYKVSVKAPLVDGAPLITTKKNAGNNSNDATDSDIEEYKQGDSEIESDVVTLGSKEDNLTVYAGYIQKICLGDKVWYDENLNGLQDGGESGVVGIKVHLTYADGSVVKDVYGNEVKLTKTDKSGNYKFCNLIPARDYKIKFDMPEGYNATLKDKGSELKDSDANKSGVIIVKNPTKDDLTLDTGIYCNCDDYKVNPQNHESLSAPAFNVLGLVAMLTAVFVLVRRED